VGGWTSGERIGRCQDGNTAHHCRIEQGYAKADGIRNRWNGLQNERTSERAKEQTTE